MITELVLRNIPYVDGPPGDGQTRINWIKNGERICGASSDLSNDGTLNRPAVQVQTNAAILHQNDSTAASKLNEVIAVVNNINASLDQIGDNTIIELVNANNVRIQDLEHQNQMVDGRLGDLERDTTALHTTIGTRDPDDTSERTVMGELFFQKKEMGSYPGFNLDGMPDIGNAGSGMKYRISQLSLALANYDQRISKIESDWQQSDVGALTARMDQMRIELGPQNSATGLNVYLRLNTLEQSSETHGADIEALKTKIGFDMKDSINDRVGTNETKVRDLDFKVNDQRTGLIQQVQTLTQVVGNPGLNGSLVAEMTDVKNEQTRIMGIVGENDSQGIRAQMASINTQIGTDGEADSIRGRLSSLSQESQSLNIELSNLQGIVGNSSTGMVAATAQVAKDIYGDATSSDMLVKEGLKKSVARLAAKDDNFIEKAHDSGSYFIRNNTLTKMTDMYADLTEKNKTVNVEAEGTLYPIPFDAAIAPVVYGVTHNQTVTFERGGIVKVEAQVYARVTNQDFTHNVTMKHASADAEFLTYDMKITGATTTHDTYTLTALIPVNANDTLTFNVQAANAQSLGNFTAEELHIIITPVI